MPNLSSVLTIEDIGPEPDLEAIRISEWWSEWKGKRNSWEEDAGRRRDYIFATDTRTTDNATLPWKNSTTTPKLCQIRDNLHANYMAALFPNDDWLKWEGANPEAVNKDVVSAIQAHMKDKLRGSKFKNEISRLLYDYIDYGNAFAAVHYVSDAHEGPQGESIPRYSGPIVTRISPLDIVFDIGAVKFKSAPKIIRTVISMGQLQADVSRLTGDDAVAYQEAVDKVRDFRAGLSTITSVDFKKKTGVTKDGFGDLQSYTHSPDVEILTFYGDLYIADKDILKKNHKVTILDRRYVLSSVAQDNEEGEDPIHHVGWRLRPDNLMAMGPLDNLVGLQYRVDHLENLRADMMDMTAFPMTKIKGDSVEDFEYEPGAKVYMDSDDDVEFMRPDTTALNADLQIARHMDTMEEMAGSPKQAMGFRTPGEKTAFEVQTLENAAGRIFQNKIRYFEELFMEPVVNTMYALSKKNAGILDTVREVNPATGVVDFRDIRKEDLTHSGRLRPVGARHFIEKAQAVQNLQQLFASPMGQDPQFLAHWSPIKLSLAAEDLLDLEKYNIVSENIRIIEGADTQALANTAEDQVAQESLVDTQEL
jgi:hypothetical protein